MAIEHASIEKAAQIIFEGGVIAYPTEACFGIGCAPDNEQGIARIRRLKQRSPEQGFVVVADKLERVQNYINWSALNAAQKQAIESSWPGAINWLLPITEHCPRALTGQYETLAVRVSAFDSLRRLCKMTKSALVSSSANMRGAPPLKTALAVADHFQNELDYVVDLPIQGLDNPCRIIDAKTQHIIRPA